MSIVEIAKRTLELSERATKGPLLREHNKLKHHTNDILANCEYCEEEPFVMAQMNRNMDNWHSDLAMLIHSYNNCEQLAKAVILMREALEFYSEKHPWTIADIVLAKIDAPNLAAVDALGSEEK